MQDIIEFAYSLFGTIMSLYGLYFGIVSLCFLLRKKPAEKPEDMLSFAVLVAARNEEKCIEGIIESIKRQNYPAEKVDVYVIPNNCTDNTEQVALASGANIIHVSSSVHSKGAALHEAFEYFLHEKKYDAYCVFDADNEAHPDFLLHMNTSLHHDRVAKSRIFAKNAHQGWVSSCYETYFCNANVMLNSARSRLGLSARLIGTGFALRHDLLEELGGWNTHSLTEDAEFYTLLSTRGEHIAFCSEAITYDEQPLSFRESVIQRRRWMSGIMDIAGEKMPGLLRALAGRGRIFAFDTLMQLSFAWMQALSIPVFILWAIVSPTKALGALPEMILSFYLCTFFVGAAALVLEKRLTRFTAISLFIYPLFVFSFLPLQTMSMFLPNRKWTPIHHSGVRIQKYAS